MQSVYQAALAHISAYEGGEVNDPSDPGGHTNMGITQRTLDRVRRKHPDAGLPISVSDLTRANVEFIFRVEYWNPCRCSDLPGAIAIMAFDCAVNQGIGDAIRFIQRSAGATVDGLIGPKTIAAANHCDSAKMLREMAALRGYDYALLDNLDDRFGLGWMRRLFACYDLAIKFL
jgi:lysozyme family protein